MDKPSSSTSIMKKILLACVTWKCLVYLFAYTASFIFPLSTGFLAFQEFGARFPYLIWIWGNFDGIHYMQIARSGYFPLKNAFFPLYPKLIELLSDPFDIPLLPYIISGQLISNIAFFLALLVLSRNLLIDNSRHLLLTILTAIVLFPTSFFYGAVYNDSLFLLFSILTIYFARRRSFLLASACGALATLTRFNGLALIFIILFEYLAVRGEKSETTWNFREMIIRARKALSVSQIIKEKIYSIIFVPLAFLSYLLYTQVKFGDWFLVFSSLQVWNQNKITFPLQVFWRYFKILVLHPTFAYTYWVALLELLFVLFYLFLLVYSYKKIRLSYWVFFAASILIPSLTGTFSGMPRYALHLYPFFLALSLLLASQSTRFKVLYFIVSIGLLFLYIGLFTRGYFVA